MRPQREAPLLIVVTDLDGSLLDHHSYRFDAAEPALAVLAARGIPVVFASSKTCSEMLLLRRALDNSHPFIVENGAAVYIPMGYFAKQPEDTEIRGQFWVRSFAPPRARWTTLLGELSRSHPGDFEYFARAGVDGIVAMTGLDADAARAAAAREYSEPLQWRGSDAELAMFRASLAAAGATVNRGGRFLTISGPCDKGAALRWLRGAYERCSPGRAVRDLAIGDGDNDISMLEAAHSALLIRSPVNAFPRVQRAMRTGYSDEPGPAGWTQGVLHWLQAQDNPAESGYG